MTNNCPANIMGSGSIADGLKAIDCTSANLIENAFGRFFGQNGQLSQVLSIVLVIYVAIFAIGLLTGRGQLKLSNLSPKILTIGFVLTFATSWVAYQNVVLNLALGAPEQLASMLMGTKGSASEIFATRLDNIFSAIAGATLELSQNGQANTPPPQLNFTINLMGLAAMMLLLSTVGVLIVARIALAAVLVLGPIFIIMALFSGTRGLFLGWLKAIIMLAFVPLLAVLLGGATISLLAPMIDSLKDGMAAIDIKFAVAIFLGASIHVALMLMAIIVAMMLVSAWQIKNQETNDLNQESNNLLSNNNMANTFLENSNAQNNVVSNNDARINGMINAIDAANYSSDNIRSQELRNAINLNSNNALAASDLPSSKDARPNSIGQKFRRPQQNFKIRTQGNANV